MHSVAVLRKTLLLLEELMSTILPSARGHRVWVRTVLAHSPAYCTMTYGEGGRRGGSKGSEGIGGGGRVEVDLFAGSSGAS